MKKIAAMTAIIALVSMPVLAAGQGGFTGPSTTTTTPGWRLHPGRAAR
ncbi:protein ygiW [Klebsiella pneumoniae]|uniref:Protein ygiW n=1 Tax=Klebsiella pneumoniae TaxID=573 RepID=A0A2X3H913_KLEPN|nr:protein ygiW [Klebsiella pneumoniae]